MSASPSERPNFENKRNLAKTLLKRLLAYVKPHWLKFVVSVLAMGVVAATEPAVAAQAEAELIAAAIAALIYFRSAGLQT